MTHNVYFPVAYVGYPSLGESYSPNLLMNARIQRFINNNKQNVDVDIDINKSKKEELNKIIVKPEAFTFNVMPNEVTNNGTNIILLLTCNHLIGVTHSNIQVISSFNYTGQGPIDATVQINKSQNKMEITLPLNCLHANVQLLITNVKSKSGITLEYYVSYISSKITPIPK
jgi:hypothetical protein